MPIKKLLLVLPFLLSSACGYHLRGHVQLAPGMEAIYVESASFALQQELKNVLRSSDGKIVDSVTDAGVVISVSKEESTSRVVSISAAGRANQFQLTYQLLFSLSDPLGNPLSAEQAVTIKREYFNDQTDILGKTNEENVIRGEMIKQAANSVISRVTLATEAKPNPN